MCEKGAFWMKFAGKRAVCLALVCLLGMLSPLGAAAAQAGEGASPLEEALWQEGAGGAAFALLETEEGRGEEALGETAAQLFEADPASLEDGSFYSQLNARAKACYDALEAIPVSRVCTAALSGGYRQVVVNVEETAGVVMSEANSRALYTDICAAIVALRYDRPDCLWLAKMRYGPGVRQKGGVTLSTGQVNFSFFLHYDGEEQTLWDRSREAAQAVAGLVDPQADRYTQVKTVHDQLASQAVYNSQPAEGREESLSHQAYSCLISGDEYEPVCDGYAKAFKMVCDLLGIPCVLAISSTHMWNNVLMDDGEWYNLDLTWDDAGAEVVYQYFLVGSQTEVNGTPFNQQADHLERSIWQETSSSLNPVEFSYPVKNRAGYEYLGQDYPALRFPDVKRTAWYYGSVEKAAQLGLFQGDEQELFQPGKAITRGQFVRTLYNAFGQPGAGDPGFSDVARDAWYYEAVAWASESQVISGYEDGTFRPGQPITRQEMCTVLGNYLMRFWPGCSYVTGEKFPDDSAIAGWAKDAVYNLQGAGVITGDEKGNFNPRQNTQRSHAAVVLVRFVELLEQRAQGPSA